MFLLISSITSRSSVTHLQTMSFLPLVLLNELLRFLIKLRGYEFVIFGFLDEEVIRWIYLSYLPRIYM